MSLKDGRKKASTDSEFLDNLTCFFKSFEDLDEAAIREELKEEGINPEKLLSRAKVLIEAKLKEAKMSWKNAALEKKNLMLEQISSAKYEIPHNSEELRKKIKELLSKFTSEQLPSYAQAFYRKLDQITEEDLKSFYSDLKRLEHLKKKFKDENIE